MPALGELPAVAELQLSLVPALAAKRSGRLCGRRGFARGRVRQAAVESRPSGARVFLAMVVEKESVLLFFHGPGTAAGIVMQTLL